MNREVKDFKDKYNLDITSYEERNSIKIIGTNNGKYVLKRKNKENNGIYDYLLNKDFKYIIEKEEIDGYEVYPYIDEVNIAAEEKAIELVLILSLLHNKTTYYREISLDKVKELYEELNDKIDYLNNYYHEIQDIIEQKVYMSPAEYLLIRNISLVYSALNFSKNILEKWYEVKSNEKKERVVLLHNSPDLSHILIGKDKRIISWDKCRRDIPIYDFLYLYQHEYMDLEMESLFDIYQSRFSYTDSEYLLFIAMISIPDKIVLNKNNYKAVEEVNRFIKYVSKTRDFVLKNYKEEQSENEDKLNKQNNSI